MKTRKVYQDASSLKWFVEENGLMDTDHMFKTEKEAIAYMRAKNHKHNWTRSKPTASVDTCACGRFRHNENNKNPVIVAQTRKAEPCSCLIDNSTGHFESCPNAELYNPPHTSNERSEFTPGPWHVGMRPGPMVYGPLGEQIADCHGMITSGEAGRNARLIAAAPDLLEALKEAHNKLVDNNLHFVRIDAKCKVCQLIAKAEGRI